MKNSIRYCTRLSVWTVVVLMLLIRSAYAVTGPTTASLSSVLNPDGTMRAGIRGSFDAHGYSVSTTPGGKPSFKPAAARGVRGVGDEYWSDKFSTNGTNGEVSALAADSAGNLYIGGNFTAVNGVAANYIAKWNGTTWSALGSGVVPVVFFNPSSMAVRALAVDANGNVYAGGDFSQAGGIPARNVAKWNGAVWSALGTGVNSTVRALAVDANNDVYAGGSFTTAGGIAASKIAKWNGTTWSALGSGVSTNSQFSPDVYAIAVDRNGGVYAGGNFYRIGNIARSIAKWDGTVWSALGSGITGTVQALAVDGNGSLYAATNEVFKWNGSFWTTLGGRNRNLVTALVVDQSGRVYASSSFTSASGYEANTVEKWDGASWTVLSTNDNNPHSTVSALALDVNGNIFAGGKFERLGNTVVYGVARWGVSATAWVSVGPLAASAAGTTGSIQAVAVDGSGNLYAAGSFRSIGSIAANNIAKWNGTSWSALGSGVDGGVFALTVDRNGEVYAGGIFTLAGGGVVNNVAKWNGAVWSALGSGIISTPTYHPAQVCALALDGAGNLYAGGFFDIAGGLAARNIAKWNGTTWGALGTGTNGPYGGGVYAIAVSGNDVYAGGYLSSAGGVPATNLAKWNGTAWNALSSQLSSASAVYSLAVDRNGDLYVGGNFSVTTPTGAILNLAKWNGTAWSALGGVHFQTVLAIALDGNGSVYVGGLTMPPSLVARNVAKWNGATWSALGSGTNNMVLSLATSGSGLYAGGIFSAVGDESRFMSSIGYYSSTLVVTASIKPQQTFASSVFPNPAHSSTSVRLPAIQSANQAVLTLVDALGRVVHTQTVNLSATGTTTEISTAALAPGVYHLHLQAGSKQANHTVVVE